MLSKELSILLVLLTKLSIFQVTIASLNKSMNGIKTIRAERDLFMILNKIDSQLESVAQTDYIDEVEPWRAPSPDSQAARRVFLALAV